MPDATLTFLGTGNFSAPPGRYWNSFVIEAEATVLVEPSPTVLPHLRRAGIDLGDLDAIVISHFHPDHTFGWPFLLFELDRQRPKSRPLEIVGPPGVAAFLEEMCRLGSGGQVHERAHDRLEIRYVEADPPAPQQAGLLRFQARRVDHVPDLDCFGYRFSLGDLELGYSGDCRPCDGLEELAASSDVLVVECNGTHAADSHMDTASLRALRLAHPSTRMIATHLGEEVTAELLEGVELPEDFDRIVLTRR